MTEKDFIPAPYVHSIEQGRYGWQSPSNIALVEYWGKRGVQLPANPSISFTLDHCHTQTWLTLSDKVALDREFSFEVIFDGQPKPEFEPKIATFFNRIKAYLPFLEAFHFKIETSNSFPHSSGIASSASGMSALALCLMSVEAQALGGMDEKTFLTKA